MSMVSPPPDTVDAHVPVIIIGAGAAGLIAALRAKSRGRDVLVLERDAIPRGSTALSAGLIPAAGTRWQREADIADSPERLAEDILLKAHGEPDPALVARIAAHVGPTLEWLADQHSLPFSVITNFNYPGHSAYRMHGLPSRSGAELMDRLTRAAEAAGVDVLCDAHVTDLSADTDGTVTGVGYVRPDGTRERIGCDTLVLACNGYGGNRDLVAEHIPQMRDALYFGHPGNQGDALVWGISLGAGALALGGHQGHGSVAQPHGILITWATMTEGGFQVNSRGARFSDESRGYSEQAAEVLAQPGAIAWSIFDQRIAGISRQFADFRAAAAAGAMRTAPDMRALAGQIGVPAAALIETANEVAALKSHAGRDLFGRNWTKMPDLVPPYHAVKVTGALFHTQGGLNVDATARVLNTQGRALPNLFAVGGAAAGISGSQASGYLSGNGLISAVALGSLAGLHV
jgi:fumarate reductase flavoprotein subunit